MDKSLIEYLINILVLTPGVVLLIVISIKMSKHNIDKFTSNKYVQVLERINLSKDINIYLLKTGYTGCVVVASQNNTQKIKDLNEEEIAEILECRNGKEKLSKLNLSSIINNH